MASSSRRVIFLNRFFYPDHAATSELLSDLAFELARRGLQIKVITSRLGYDNTANALPSHETTNGVEVFRAWTSRQGRHRLHRRILDYVSFYIAAAWQLWCVARAGDVIVAKTDPPLLSVISAAIALLRGARLVNWQQDIFPEVAEALGIGGTAGRLGFALLRRPRNWSLRRADLTVVVNDPMSSTLNRLGVAQEKIRTIPNWADGKAIVPIDASKNALRTDWGLDNHFVVGYAGNLGRAHEIDTVLSTIRALDQSPVDVAAPESSPPVKFLFIGGGALRPSLEEQARKWRLGNVQFRDYQPREQLAATLGVADVHLVILNPALEGLCMPSKLYAIAAAGRPAIFIGDPEGEVAQILRDVGCGFAVAPSNVIELKQRILDFARSPELRRIMGARARAAFEQRWDREIAVANWQRVFEELIGSEARH
jgi:colanic acid biosynthesis glycosyl transferase WcaI